MGIWVQAFQTFTMTSNLDIISFLKAVQYARAKEKEEDTELRAKKRQEDREHILAMINPGISETRFQVSRPRPRLP